MVQNRAKHKTRGCRKLYKRENEMKKNGTHYISTSMTRPYDGWPRGDYQVVLYIDGKEKLSVPFTVE